MDILRLDHIHEFMPKAQKRAVAIAVYYVRLIGYRAEVSYRTFVFLSALAERLNDCVVTQHRFTPTQHTYTLLIVCKALQAEIGKKIDLFALVTRRGDRRFVGLPCLSS